MQHYKNFRQYFPTVEERPDFKDLIEAGVGFEMDEDGRDWYDLRDTFQPDTYKVVYFEGGDILQMETDVDSLCPHGMAGVVELAEVPEGCTRETLYKYIFDGEKVKLNVDYFKDLKEFKMTKASRKVAEYQDFLEMGADVEKQLQEWREYRLALFKVDVSLMDDIEWPKAPAE